MSEKMMLINTEITELHEAVQSNPLNLKDTVQSETADILGRILHLGLAWGVDFDKNIPFQSRFKHKNTEPNESDYLYLHSLVSKGYDHYRHKKETLFKSYLYKRAKEVVYLADVMHIDIKSAVAEKVEINKERKWDKNKLQGTYYK